MTEKLYDLVVFSDGDARVYRHGDKTDGITHMISNGKTFTHTIVQTDPDKMLLMKMAMLARADYAAKRGAEFFAAENILQIDKTGEPIK